jgi:hypothetical protein
LPYYFLTLFVPVQYLLGITTSDGTLVAEERFEELTLAIARFESLLKQPPYRSVMMMLSHRNEENKKQILRVEHISRTDPR